jgi:thiol-disulfide isomerase/thioredoxin
VVSSDDKKEIDSEKRKQKATGWMLIQGIPLEMKSDYMVSQHPIFFLTHRCGPCLLMAPEFEAAAKELKDRVRFVKLDTDKEEAMAARLNIMGLPTLLFLDKYDPAEGEDVQEGAKAVLKGRIEGALRKDNIKDLCEFHFFDGPQPSL